MENPIKIQMTEMDTNRGFLKWWVSPTTMGFPTKNDHFEVFWGYHYFRKHPYEDFLRVALVYFKRGPIFF